MALRIITSWSRSSLGLIPNYVMLVLDKEGGYHHHIQGRHTRHLHIGLKKLVVLTLNIHQISIETKHISFFLSLYLCLEQRLIYINHVAICMCTS
jgi:hypothetical protein